MSEVKSDWHGSLSSTPRAEAVRAHFEENGVPGQKIGVVDNCRPHGRRYSFESVVRRVSVWEKPADKQDDLTQEEFGAFITCCNRIVNTDPNSRFTDNDETRCAISHEYIDGEIMSQNANPAQSGQDLADPSENSLSENELINVFHHGGNRFTVIRSTPSADGSDASRRVYRVDMDQPLEGGEPVSPVLNGQPQPDESEAFDVIAAVVTQGPSYREGPQEQLSVTVGAPEPGNVSDTGSSDDTTGSDTSDSEDVEVLTDPGSNHDYDPDTLEETVDQWLSNYASVKSGMIDGAWEVEFQNITNPSTGSSELGVVIDDSPWHGPLWDHDDFQFDTPDGKQPDEWANHKEALRSIYQADDDPIKGFSVENPDSDYDDWYNFVPASEASDL